MVYDKYPLANYREIKRSMDKYIIAHWTLRNDDGGEGHSQVSLVRPIDPSQRIRLWEIEFNGQYLITYKSTDGVVLGFRLENRPRKLNWGEKL